MTRARIVFAVLLWILASASQAAAQDSAKTGRLCLRAQPAPHCAAILQTNVGVSGIMGGLSNGYYGTALRPIRITVEWGLLFPIGRRAAAGPSVLVSEDVDRAFVGPALRYRRWSADQRSSTEIAVGYWKLGRSGGWNTVTSTVFGLVKFNPTPNVGIVARPEWRQVNDSSRCSPNSWDCASYGHGRFNLSAGIEISGVPGLIATVPGLLLAALHHVANIE